MAFASPLRRLRGMHRAWSLLAVAFAALFILGGARNSFGVLYKPIVEDLGGGRAGLAGAITLGQVMLGVGYVAAGLAIDRFGPRRVIPVFAVMHLAGNLLVARAEQLWEVYLGWGVLSALAFGVGVGPFLAIVTRWFQRHRGLALGITASAAQLGVVTFSPLGSLMAEGPGWRWALVFLATAPFLALLVASVTVRGRPQDVGLEPYGAEPGATSASTDARVFSFGSVIGIALRRRALWLLLGAYVGVNVGTGVVLFHLVNFGSDQGLSSVMAAGLLSAMSGVSIAGRVAFGVLTERFPVERLFAITIVMMGVGLAVLPALGGAAGYYLFASAFGLFLGGTVVFMPVMGRALFGEEFLAGILGILLLAVNVGSALGALLGGAVFDATDSYTLAFLVAAGVVGLGALLTLPVRLPAPQPQGAA